MVVDISEKEAITRLNCWSTNYVVVNTGNTTYKTISLHLDRHSVSDNGLNIKHAKKKLIEYLLISL